MRIALAFILTLMLCLTGPAQIAFACGGGGDGGGNEGVDESASTQTSDPGEPPPGFILSGDTPEIVGLLGPTSDPGDSITAPPPLLTTEVPLPGTGEGEPQNLWLTWAEQHNQAREARGLEPLQTVILPGGNAAVVNGRIVPVMGPGGPPPPPAPIGTLPGLGPLVPGVANPFVAIQGKGPTAATETSLTVMKEKPFIGPREPMTRLKLMELHTKMYELNHASEILEVHERFVQRVAFISAYAAAMLASGRGSYVAVKYGVGAAWAYTLAYATGTTLIESRGDPVAVLESTVGAIKTFELPPYGAPIKSTTINVFHSVTSPESVPVGGDFIDM